MTSRHRRPRSADSETGQPYPYRRVELVEPDWTRFPGWKDVTAAEWASAQWQRAHCVKNVRQLRELLGDLRRRAVLRRPRARPGRAGHDVDAGAAADDEHDGAARRRRPVRARSPRRSTPTRSATTCSRCSPTVVPTGPRTRTPPATRCTSTTCGWPRGSPTATRPRCWPSCCRPARSTAATAPGWTWSATPRRSVDKLKFVGKPIDRLGDMLDYLRRTPQVRDVVVSGGDVANMPWARLEDFLTRLLEIENIRDIRLATKALMGLPQHWLQDDVRGGHRAGCDAPRALARRVARDPHPRQPRQLGDPAGGRGDRRRCSTPACATSATRACCSTASTPTRTRCSTCASGCSTARRSCPTTSTCAT